MINMMQIEQQTTNGYSRERNGRIHEFFKSLRQTIGRKTHLPTASFVRSGLVIATFVISVLVLVTALAGATTIYVPDDGNQTIQEAVDNATEGDEIVVRAAYTSMGTKENIDITVPHLTIRAEDSSITVEAANPYDHVFHVKANYTTITGFMVTGTEVSDTEYSAGIYLDQVNHCDISKNNVSSNFYGIYLSSSHENTISSNVASSNKNYGIYLLRSSSNTIFGNTAHSNNNPGIHLYASNENIVAGNSAHSNRFSGISLYSSNGNTFSGNSADVNTIYGIYLSSSHSNTFSGNAATGNQYQGISLFSSNENTFSNNSAHAHSMSGIYLSRSNKNTFADNTASSNKNSGIDLSSSSENIISKNSVDSNSNYGIYLGAAHKNTISGNSVNANEIAGIYLEASSNNMISDNLALRNGQGIYLYYSSPNVIYGNNASNNHYGIYLDSSTENTIAGNTANSNTYYGIFLEASGNTIYNNYFDNTQNAWQWSSGTNSWNSSKTREPNILGGPYLGGNYWADYEGVDSDNDGLGDTLVPYTASGNIPSGGDWLPLVRDTTPLTLTDIAVTSITTDSATISWTTNKPSDSQVRYGTESRSYPLTASYVPLVIAHSVTLTGLSPGRTYYYLVASTDQNGNSVESEEGRFTTAAAAKAIIPAQVVIKPKTLNLNRNGRFFAFITLPNGYRAADVDISTVECGGAPAIKGWITRNNKQIVAIFARKDLVGVQPGSEVKLTVTGKLKDGTPFGGSDTVRVIGREDTTEVVIMPAVLNLKGSGKMTAMIMLPYGYRAADVNISSLVCEGAFAVKGKVAHNNRYLATFEIEDIGGIEPGSEVELTVSGNLMDGTPFEGSDTIRVIERDIRRR
ncbi:MAG: hypothetical protein EFT35_07020 [Methanophagales archaeon ANME-1-THS]|nr:MAG: hypothetical protein EFT35_07020 [Methanophagales archaeon ANME-1-THS]